MKRQEEELESKIKELERPIPGEIPLGEPEKCCLPFPDEDPNKNVDSLVMLIYLLGRDHLPLGDISKIVMQIKARTPSITFTNKELEAYARRIVDEILEPTHTVVGLPINPAKE